MISQLAGGCISTSPNSLTTFFAGCFRPFLILAGDPSSVLIPDLREETLVVASTVVTVVAGVVIPRLRFRALEVPATSSMSGAPGELREDNEELLSLVSSCLAAKAAAPSAEKALRVVAKDLVWRRVISSEVLLMLAASRARREVFMESLHGRYGFA